ncbi:MAG: GC-type dockerin domain-anchored protein [Planctomycetota bacterium]
MLKQIKAIAAGFAGLCAATSAAQIGPDVIVAEITGPSKWGSINGMTAYSLGTTSCNIGDEDLLWDDELFDGTPANLHPVIAQNIFMISNDRITQIGQSWLKHGFLALNLNGICGFACDQAPSNNFLGPGCYDPYSSGLNGSQGGLGAKFEVNAATGEYPWPFTGDGTGGNALFKRIQVENSKLNPSQNPGARYFAEGHYITPDDAAAGNDNNNASYREMSVGGFNNGYNLNFAGDTVRGKPAILAWADIDASVEAIAVDIEDDGRFWVAYKVIDNGDGTFRYEFAVQNLSSHLSAASFSVPVGDGVTITNVGFSDIGYHSGEPFNSIDWTTAESSGGLTWSVTESFQQNQNANALRWGTLYNFWFDADSAPEAGSGQIGLFRPTDSPEVPVEMVGPAAIPTDCLADVNMDNTLDGGDFFAWVNAFSENLPGCDQNGDEVCDQGDFFAWVANFGAGC